MLSQKKLGYSLFLLFIIAFILIDIKGLTQSQPGDENVYYYMGKLISEGKVPYRDFFYAHPPSQIYIIGVIYKIFGFNIIILKSIPLLSALISAFFIFKISEKRFGYTKAIVSALLFLFSYGVLFNSVFSFGIDTATMFLVSGLYFLFNKNNYITSGIFFGLSSVTRLLTLVPIFAVLLFVLLSSKKNFVKNHMVFDQPGILWNSDVLKLSSAFLAVFIIVNGFFALSFGENYVTPVYKFHMYKQFGGEENLKEYLDIVKLNWVLFLSALILIFIKEKKPIHFFIFVSIIYLAFLATLKKIFGFYFIVVFPFLAIIGGYSIVNLYQKLNINKKLKIAISIILLLLFFWNLVSDIIFLEKIGFVGFERGNDLRDFVLLNSNKNTLLFGDESIVPLLALMTNKKIAMDFVDTNEQIFISGVKNLNSVLSDLKGKDTLFIIRTKQGISYFKEVKGFLNKNCIFLSQFYDRIEGSYLIYRCE